ncbi:zinc finger, CCHC-type, Retrotransposon gag domain protein [Artemisia annua]|uniref:Zinc finger, CCHC-type, Retrotransposon gag domain protein n=1 Tax=Artemisia annua TaxID=35608 RepID=A0A2U1PXF1_ARTAN|nr:zinc finger, CCHC-type, Retrotransposon gag domain protein [Artemisia annua]
MEGKGGGGSKQNPGKNQDVPVTKGELSKEIVRIMSEHMPTILAQSQENFRKAEEARKAAEEAEKKKKANEDAEKRRKAMEDKRAAEEQERKRKAEQDRKNAEDAERLRNEESERRRNEEAQRDGCSYKSFLICKPSEFHGENDPVIVTNWLKEIEDIFEISECSPRKRVNYASHLLKGEARHWWNMIKIARGNEAVSAMTWEQFEELVMENYCPQGLMDKLEEEFLKLQQNDMTVPKYTAKFNEKARFAKYQVATEERRIKRYIWGLRAGIRGPVQQARPSTFQEAVELALMVEKENNRQLEEGGDNKRKRENRDDDAKKIKISGGKIENVGEYKLCTICKKTHKGECWHDNCRNCGKSGHTSKECKAEPVCFKCKSPGHKIVDCPERKLLEYKDTQPRKTMGRVFQLTAENARNTP